MTIGMLFGLAGLAALLVAPWLVVPAAGSLAIDGVVLIFAAGWEYIR